MPDDVVELARDPAALLAPNAVREPGLRHATKIIRQALIVANAEVVERALVTCDDNNATSRRVIERCGDVLEDLRPTESGGRTRRYWIG